MKSAMLALLLTGTIAAAPTFEAVADMGEQLYEAIYEAETSEDMEAAFVEYEEYVIEHSEMDAPDTIYDEFTEEEIQLFQKVVEAEVTGGGFIEKLHVADVIMNRYADGRFGKTLGEILNKRQFSCISDGRYNKVAITESTIHACEAAYLIDDTTGGALYFEGKNSNIHSKYATFIFQDNVGHKFSK